jgi:hypothetical protein
MYGDLQLILAFRGFLIPSEPELAIDITYLLNWQSAHCKTSTLQHRTNTEIGSTKPSAQREFHL